MEGHERAAKIRAARVDHRDGLMKRDLPDVAQIGGDHRERGGLTRQAPLHLLYHLHRGLRGMDPLGLHAVPLQKLDRFLAVHTGLLSCLRPLRAGYFWAQSPKTTARLAAGG